LKISVYEKRRRIAALSRIHWGNRSPTSQLKRKEARIALKDEFERFARGRKTLSVRKTEANVQNMKRNVTMRLGKAMQSPLF
jgi:hypothetical protein